MKERGVEHGHGRDIREQLPDRLDAEHIDRVVQWRQVFEFVDGLDHVVVDDGRFVELRSAVDDPVADGGDAFGRQITILHPRQLQRFRQPGPVIGDLSDELFGVITPDEYDLRLGFTDAFHHTVRDHSS